MDVSIIIVNYNTKQVTQSCINSIVEHSHGFSYEIILVDNHSTDGSYALFSNDARIKYVYNEKNVGFGQANNIGYQYSTGDFIFLLNSDTLLLNNAIKLFYDKMRILPLEIGCIGTMLVDGKGDESLSYGKFPTVCSSFYHLSLCEIFKLDSHFYRYFNYKGKPTDWMEVEYVTGADIFIRRSIIEKYGLFDPAYFLYYEETDMQRRYFSYGIKNAIINGPQIVHLEAGSTKNKVVTLDRICIPYVSCFLFLKKWTSLWKYILFRIAFALTRFPHLFFNVKFPLKDRIKLLKKVLI